MDTNRYENFPQPPSFEAVLKTLNSSLLSVIREAIAEGCLHVSEYANWQAEPIDFSLAPNLVRHKAKQYLASQGQEAQEEDCEKAAFATEQISNNGLCLKAPGFRIRILKSADDGSIPQPGNSTTRQNFYNQLQALLDFEEFRNGNSRVQPVWGLIVHWTVDSKYDLLRLCIALPLSATRNDSGRLIVESAFDEPCWTKSQPNVVRFGETAPPTNLDLPIEEEADGKTGEDHSEG